LNSLVIKIQLFKNMHNDKIKSTPSPYYFYYLTFLTFFILLYKEYIYGLGDSMLFYFHFHSHHVLYNIIYVTIKKKLVKLNSVQNVKKKNGMISFPHHFILLKFLFLFFFWLFFWFFLTEIIYYYKKKNLFFFFFIWQSSNKIFIIF
jgi:hypothetical protein